MSEKVEIITFNVQVEVLEKDMWRISTSNEDNIRHRIVEAVAGYPGVVSLGVTKAEVKHGQEACSSNS